MSDEEYNNHLAMIKYFWDEKGDPTRYCSWEIAMPEIMARNPEIIKAYTDYKITIKIFDAVINNLEL